MLYEGCTRVPQCFIGYIAPNTWELGFRIVVRGDMGEKSGHCLISRSLDPNRASNERGRWAARREQAA